MNVMKRLKQGYHGPERRHAGGLASQILLLPCSVLSQSGAVFLSLVVKQEAVTRLRLVLPQRGFVAAFWPVRKLKSDYEGIGREKRSPVLCNSNNAIPNVLRIHLCVRATCNTPAPCPRHMRTRHGLPTRSDDYVPPTLFCSQEHGDLHVIGRKTQRQEQPPAYVAPPSTGAVCLSKTARHGSTHGRRPGASAVVSCRLFGCRGRRRRVERSWRPESR